MRDYVKSKTVSIYEIINKSFVFVSVFLFTHKISFTSNVRMKFQSRLLTNLCIKRLGFYDFKIQIQLTSMHSSLLFLSIKMLVFIAAEQSYLKHAKFASFDSWAALNQKQFNTDQAKEQKYF